MSTQTVDLGQPYAGATINGTAERAVNLLLRIRHAGFEDVERVTFTFNDTRVEVRPTDTTTRVVARYWDDRERR